MNLRHIIVLLTIAILALGHVARADVEVYFDFAEWQSALSFTTTIGFTGFPDGTLITNQYESQGVTFASPRPFTLSGFDSFPNDGSGLHSSSFSDEIVAHFSTPQYGVATHFPGAIQFALFADGALIYESEPFGVGVGLFVGFVSDTPFTQAVLFDPTPIGLVVIDDLHFGVPGPGALPLLALTAIIGSPRRR